jgi:hypothetical protein
LRPPWRSLAALVFVAACSCVASSGERIHAHIALSFSAARPASAPLEAISFAPIDRRLMSLTPAIPPADGAHR